MSRSPIEGERKVVVLFDAERLRLNEAAANTLLKTLEEPPPRAVIILVTSGADQLLPTIRSRCQRVDFAYLGADAVAAALVADGIPPDRAELLARLSGGRSTGPARSTAASVRCATRSSRRRGRRSTARAVRSRCRPSGSRTRCRRPWPSLEAAQAEEVEQLDGRARSRRLPRAHPQAQLRRLEDRHKRAHRRARTDALVEGITALETVYRDALAASTAERLNVDRDLLVVEPRAAAAALDACRDARQAIGEFNPNETLLVERLLLHLPTPGRGPEALRGG